ncbi:MAG: hypothetical protein QXL94_06510 [Candidatus Parvarchaeum sp.]
MRRTDAITEENKEVKKGRKVNEAPKDSKASILADEKLTKIEGISRL